MSERHSVIVSASNSPRAILSAIACRIASRCGSSRAAIRSAKIGSSSHSRPRRRKNSSGGSVPRHCSVSAAAAMKGFGRFGAIEKQLALGLHPRRRGVEPLLEAVDGGENPLGARAVDGRASRSVVEAIADLGERRLVEAVASGDDQANNEVDV
jgi:hypothetical protein